MSDSKIHIVLIEDEKQIRRFLSTAIESESMSAFEAETGKQGLITCATRKPDLVILDLGLPDIDGLDVIRELRSWSAMPIIVLSARSQEHEKVAALDAGADDFLSKPFGAAELLARVRAHLRRRQQVSAENENEIRFGDIQVDFGKRIVLKAGNAVHLSPLEYRLLSVLIRNRGKVLTHRQLLHDVWGPNHSESSHYLRIYMANLRQKLEQDPAQPQYFITETGVGYRLIA